MNASPIRIVYLIDNLLHGGTQTFLLNLARSLRDRGYAQRIICLNRADSSLLGLFRTAAIPVEVWPAWQSVSGFALLRLAILFREERTQVVQTMLTCADVLGRLAGRVARRPIIVSSLRGYLAPWQHLVNRLTLPLAHSITVNADSLRSLVGARKKMTSRIVTIHNGIDVESVPSTSRSEARAALGLGEHEFALGCVGRLSVEKGQRDLMAAFEQLAAVQGTAVLLLIGDGPDRRRLQTMASASRFASQIRLLGARVDACALLTGLDLLVLPSRDEGMPNIVLEAMAAGLPVVATRVGGVPDIVQDGVTGILVRPQDDEGLASAIERLAQNPQKRLQMVDAGRTRVAKDFPLSSMVDGYDQLYRGLLAVQCP
jgi:glycosyltransferase involved in cell wall biosynthesis